MNTPYTHAAFLSLLGQLRSIAMHYTGNRINIIQHPPRDPLTMPERLAAAYNAVNEALMTAAVTANARYSAHRDLMAAWTVNVFVHWYTAVQLDAVQRPTEEGFWRFAAVVAQRLNQSFVENEARQASGPGCFSDYQAFGPANWGTPPFRVHPDEQWHHKNPKTEQGDASWDSLLTMLQSAHDSVKKLRETSGEGFKGGIARNQVTTDHVALFREYVKMLGILANYIESTPPAPASDGLYYDAESLLFEEAVHAFNDRILLPMEKLVGLAASAAIKTTEMPRTKEAQAKPAVELTTTYEGVTIHFDRRYYDTFGEVIKAAGLAPHPSDLALKAGQDYEDGIGNTWTHRTNIEQGNHEGRLVLVQVVKPSVDDVSPITFDLTMVSDVAVVLQRYGHKPNRAKIDIADMRGGTSYLDGDKQLWWFDVVSLGRGRLTMVLRSLK